MDTRLIPTYSLKPNRTLSERQRRIYDFLSEYPVGVLTTVTMHHQPHGTVIYFTVDKQFTITFLTKTNTQKRRNLLRNDSVMLVVYEPVSQTIAQVVGTAHEINDAYQVNRIAQRVLKASLKTSEAGVPPITKLHAGAYTAFIIVPTQIRMAVYERPDDGEYNQIFESIESFELTE